jgi:hypothetical protein
VKERYALIAALLAWMVSDHAAAQQACTEMGCQNGLQLTVAPDYRWSPGAYVFKFLVDGVAIQCRGKLPLPSCDNPGLICDSTAVTITESGCALPSAAHGFGMVQFADAPQTVRVTITRDNVMLVDKNFTPEYRDVRPNGAQCEPTCHQASAVLLTPSW